MHWSHGFVQGHRSRVESAAVAREAGLRYMRQTQLDSGRYLYDSVSVVEKARVWLVVFPRPKGWMPEEAVMGIDRQTGRVGWVGLK